MKIENNYIALDLELNTENGNTTYIIEVGISIGSIKEGPFFNKSWLVKPTFDLEGNFITNHKLSDCIITLTGITQEIYDEKAVSLEEMFEDFVEIVDFYKPFVNPVTWGLGDAHELKKSFEYEGIHFPYFGRRVIDVKHFFLFIEAANGRSLAGGLKKSMAKHKLKFEGTPHRAAIDAKNTLVFFFHLLKRQNILESTIDTFKLI